MNTVKWRALTRAEKLYFAQFALIGVVVTAIFLSIFGLPSIVLAAATGALTAVSFAAGRLEGDYGIACISLVPFGFAVALAVMNSGG